jgi:signal transduction histidine kinase
MWPVPGGGGLDTATGELAIIVTDDRGLVSSFSSNLPGLGIQGVPERLGRHWTEFFPRYRRVPTHPGDGDDFIVMLETTRKAFRVTRCPFVAANGERGGAFLVLRPFETHAEEGRGGHPLAALNELAAGVAHEINNPLTTISGWMQIFLADSNDGDPLRGQIESIQEELDRIARIVDRLLAFAQKPRADSELLDANELLRSVVSFLEYQFKNAAVRVETELSSAVPAIEGNSGELKQVFLNLMINARQAMVGGGVVRLATSLSADGSWVEIRFADAGHGVPAEVRDRLFEPHVTTRADEGGSGLGLSVSREIVEKMSGTLELESTSPAGSTFLIRLPVPRTA